MKTVHDFNYKVALASGLKHMQAGRLRQAEEQFRYLVSKFPKADGGYRGLARVQLELGDRAAALATLREGATALTRAGDRTVAIDLLREAVQLDPIDLSAHRRLAAALALAGDISGAAAEYVRYTQLEMTTGDPERAKLEASYALETFGEIPALHELARSMGLGLRTLRPSDAAPARAPASPAPAPETAAPQRPVIDERTALFGRAPETEAPAPSPTDAWTTPAPAAADTWMAPPAEPAPEPSEAETEERAAMLERLGMLPASPTAPAPSAPSAPPPAAVAPPPGPNALELEERAAALIARKDPGAGAAAIEAASALLEAGKVHAASDLLLALVASGTAVHDAALELIAVAMSLGRKDIATDRATLLASVMRLSGEEDRAAQVEQIGRSL